MIAALNMPETAPTETDIQLALESSRRLAAMVSPDQPLKLAVVGDRRRIIEIPAAAAQLLVQLLAEMAQGNAVTLIPIHAELTTQRVADLLGVSRPFVVKRIKDGQLPARKVGTHRRVLFEDVVRYKKRMDAERQKALDELALLDQELGLD